MRRFMNVLLISAVALQSAFCAGVQEQPRVDPLLVEKGRQIFFDKRLSVDGTVSCASCHQPDHAYSDPRAVSEGVSGKFGHRHAPSLVDVSDRSLLFWDGRAGSLRSQALQPLLNQSEHGFRDVRALERRLAEIDAGSSHVPTANSRLEESLRALAAFESTLRSPVLSVDRLSIDPNDPSVPDPVRRGFSVFVGVGQCSSCHATSAGHASLTDERFHPSSVGLAAQALDNMAHSLERIRVAKQSGSPSALGQLITDSSDVAALGRFVITGRLADIGKFKTPGLRSVALSAPYMHDGSVPTLEEALDRELYRVADGLRRPSQISKSQRKDLLAFLSSLDGNAAGPP